LPPRQPPRALLVYPPFSKPLGRPSSSLANSHSGEGRGRASPCMAWRVSDSALVVSAGVSALCQRKLSGLTHWKRPRALRHLEPAAHATVVRTGAPVALAEAPGPIAATGTRARRLRRRIHGPVDAVAARVRVVGVRAIGAVAVVAGVAPVAVMRMGAASLSGRTEKRRGGERREHNKLHMYSPVTDSTRRQRGSWVEREDRSTYIGSGMNLIGTVTVKRRARGVSKRR
jgi:hypothetical protein